MQLTKLPDHLSERISTKVCHKNFTISELVLNMINNDNFRVELFNLELKVIDKDYLSFDEDVISLDILKFSDDNMIKKFKELVIDGWIRIRLFIFKEPSAFDFLIKYSERHYCVCDEKFHLGKEVKEYVFNTESSPVNTCLHALQFFDVFEVSKKVKVQVKGMNVEKAVEFLHKVMMNVYDSYQKFFFNFEMIQTLELVDDHCVDKMEIDYRTFENYLETHKFNVENFEIEIRMVLIGGEYNTLNVLPRKILDKDIKNIKKLSLFSHSDEKCNFKFDCIKDFEYLETLDIKCVIDMNHSSVGSLKNMKYLKEINFAYANVDYSWMSEYLPKNIERIKIFQNDEYQKSKSVFKVPSSLKMLEIEIDDNGKGYQFDRFDFTNAVSLSHIHLSNFLFDDYVFNPHKFFIRIEGLKEVPKSLRYLIFYDDYRNLIREFREPIRIAGIDMNGIYSNINKYDNDLCLVRN